MQAIMETLFDVVYLTLVNMGARSRSTQSGAPGIGEEIEDLDLSGRILFQSIYYNRRKPVPVDSLLREKPCVFETEGLQMKCEVQLARIIISDIPLLWQFEKFPLASAFGTSVVMSVWLLPLVHFLGCVPYYLGVRPY